MRVAITHPYSWPEVRRGAERIAVETARALAARGHEVTVLTAGNERGRTIVDGFAVVRYQRRFAEAARHERWFGWRIVPQLVTGRYDVVHSLMPWDALAAIRTARIGGHTPVYEELGIPIKAWWEDKPDRYARLQVARRAAVYGCMSQFALGAYERDFGREGALIPGGVRVAEFAPAAERESRPTVLFSGVLDEPRKGVATLLEAIPLVARDEPDVQLWLSGPGDVGPAIEAAPPGAAERTVVLDVGDPHAQSERYGRAWATALPSVNESFGMVLVESLACGTPIVVADHSAPPELVAPGVGAVCPPGDARALAAALLTALRLARDPSTVQRARAVAAAYDWDEAIAPGLEATYRGRTPARR
jgi:phosphatidylinositol alpha-mannosyltransferase